MFQRVPESRDGRPLHRPLGGETCQFSVFLFGLRLVHRKYNELVKWPRGPCRVVEESLRNEMLFCWSPLPHYPGCCGVGLAFLSACCMGGGEDPEEREGGGGFQVVGSFRFCPPTGVCGLSRGGVGAVACVHTLFFFFPMRTGRGLGRWRRLCRNKSGRTRDVWDVKEAAVNFGEAEISGEAGTRHCRDIPI